MKLFAVLPVARMSLALAMIALPVSVAIAQNGDSPRYSSGDSPRYSGGDSRVCVPGTQVEAMSEGGWYPATVLDALRDGRCFVHYENYGSDDDEALAPNEIRSRR